MKDLVSIIIVNWNGRENLRECIESLLKITYPHYEIIVVDNGSTDGSQVYIQALKSMVKHLDLIENKKNLGFAEANNIGYRKARGEYILFLNNDTVVEKEFLEPLLMRLQDDAKTGAVQPLILQYPQTSIIDSVGSYLLPTGFLYHKGHNKKIQEKYKKEDEIFTMKGACMLFRREVLEKTGLFDKAYFAYFEETDLCQRTWIAGYKILYIPTSIMYHKGGETSRKLDVSFINYHSYKNRIYTYLKNFDSVTLLKVLPLHLLFCQMAALIYILTFKLNMAFAIERAVLWNVFNLGKTARERKKIKLFRARPDQEFLPYISRSVRLSYYYHLFTTSLKGYED